MQPSSAPFTYPALPKGAKVVTVTLAGEENGGKDGFNGTHCRFLLCLVLLCKGANERL